MKRITIIVNRTINKKCIREKRERDVLEEFRRFHSPAPQSLFQEKKEGGKKGKGEGRGDVMPFIDCPISNKPNQYMSRYFMYQLVRSSKNL